MHIQAHPDRWSNVESAHTPLIAVQPQYPIYHPKRAYIYGQKSRSNCCCVLTCLICTTCCCLFFLVSAILGGIIAAYAIQCGNINSDQLSFSYELSNVTQIEIVNHNGFVKVITSEDHTSNITITSVRRAANDADLSRFTETFYVQNGNLYFEEELPGQNNFWEAIIKCASAEITVVVPKWIDGRNVLVKNTNGDISVDLIANLNKLVLTTSNGEISVDATAGSVSTTSTNGNILFQHIHAPSFYAKTTNGDVEIRNGSLVGTKNTTSQFEVSTTNGDISIVSLIATSQSKLKMSSTNGDLNASIDDYSGQFDIETTNGKISLSGDVHYSVNDKKSKSGTVGNGEGSLSFKTTNGDVSISFE